MRLSYALALLALAMIPSASQAQCAKPEAPACALQRVPFESDMAADACRKEMLAFRDAMKPYAECRGKTSKDDQAAADDEYEDVRIRFNKRARGEFE
jgi:hypothetical protein